MHKLIGGAKTKNPKHTNTYTQQTMVYLFAEEKQYQSIVQLYSHWQGLLLSVFGCFQTQTSGSH